jgi:hypothetical protein
MLGQEKRDEKKPAEAGYGETGRVRLVQNPCGHNARLFVLLSLNPIA